jgi:Cu(I)/Ag(I) efflux system membrane protein CusA/SilA
MMGALLLALLLLPSVAQLLLARRAARPGFRGERWTDKLTRRLSNLDLVRELLIAGLACAWAYVARSPWSLAAALVLALAGVASVALKSRPSRPPEDASAATSDIHSPNGPGAPRSRRLEVVLRATQLLTLGLAVLVELALRWAPFGPARDLVNLLFVAGVVGGLLGAFSLFARVYPRLLALFLNHRRLFLLAPALVVVAGTTAWLGFERLFGWLPSDVRSSASIGAIARALPGFGREYMPPFDEGAYLYMPTTMPHASFGEVNAMVSGMDARIQQIPEVDRVVGKFGRVDSALDPAPVSMIETIITYLPEYRSEPDGTRVRQWRDHIRSPRDIWDEIVRVAATPGVTSAPVLMPINARIVMLQSGMRAPMGIKVSGPTLEAIESFGMALEAALRDVPSVRAETVFADRVVGKPYLEIELDRVAIARYGLSVRAVQSALQVAVGGMTLTRTVEGRERYPVRVRYMREERDSVEALEALSVPTPGGEHVPLAQLARLRYVRGPQMIRSEDTFLTSYVLFDHDPAVSEVEVVEEARAHLEREIAAGRLEVPTGVRYRFAGSYENQVRSEQRLMLLIPVALALVFVLLFLQFRRVRVSLMIYAGVVVAVSGAFILLWLYGQPWFLNVELAGTSLRDLFQVRTVNMSVAVWVGVIALVGVATDDGVVMATYLQQLFRERPPETVEDVRALTLEAGQRRVRPCLMTTATTILALLPVITSQGRGADVMIPMALPSIGGMVFELMTLFVVPVLYSAYEERRVARRSPPATAAAVSGGSDCADDPR